jgi:hypothetical protein
VGKRYKQYDPVPFSGCWRRKLRACKKTREIRIDSEMTDEKGDKAHLKEGAEVEVIVEPIPVLL